MDHKLTILVPTYCRPDRLKRSVSYWSQRDFPCLIADGSPQTNKDIIPTNFKYYWDPNQNLFDRWYSSISLVKTPYFILCADDDFIGFDAIAKCVNFLESYSEYSCAHGLYGTFVNHKGGYQFSELYKLAKICESVQSSNTDRIVDKFQNYFLTMYSVQRTENVRRFLNGFPSLSNGNAFEMQFTLGNAIFGNHKIFPFLYGVREGIDNSAGCTTPNLDHWKTSDPQSFNEWRNFCADLIQREVPGISDGGQLFDQAFSAYCEFLEKNYGPRIHSAAILNQIKNRTKNLIKRFIPANLLAKLRPKNLNLLTGWEPDLVEMTRRLYGEESVPDAIRIQNAIFAESEL